MTGQARSIVFGVARNQPLPVWYMTMGKFARGRFIKLDTGGKAIIHDCSPDAQSLKVTMVDEKGEDISSPLWTPARSARQCYLDELPQGRVRCNDEEAAVFGYTRRLDAKDIMMALLAGAGMTLLAASLLPSGGIINAAAFVMRTGQKIFLEAGLNKTAGQDLNYDLFTNSITPGETDTAGSYTLATGGGYAQKPVAGSAFTTASASTPTSISAAAVTWTFTGALTTNPDVHGYFVRQQTSGILVYSESETAFTPTTSGDNIQLTPTLTATHT